MRTVVVDIDSTLADTAHRHHLVPTENRHANESWHRYSLACFGDTPIEGMCALVRLLHPHYHVVLLTGRNDIAEPQTVAWLSDITLPYDTLRMRADHELGTVDEYKIMALRELIEQGHEIALVIDDFPEVCGAVAAQLGIPAVCPTLPAHYVMPEGKQLSL